MKANLRQRLFAEAWLATRGNGTESARRAGYRGSTNTLAAHASTLIRNPKVQALIAARTEEVLIKVHRGASPEAVIQELSDQMYGRKPARWKVKDQQYDAQGAATTLGRLFRMDDRRTVRHAPPKHLNLLLHRIAAVPAGLELLHRMQALIEEAETLAATLPDERRGP